jgi:aminoglycoside phosphotransferase (APT) family kinase protein
MLMDRMPGRPAIPDLTRRPAALPGLARAAARLPDLLARISARLHALDPVPLQQSLSATPDAVANPGEFLELLEVRAGGLRSHPDLAAAAAWMRANPPPAPRPPGRVAICHGDLHPFNLLVDGDRVSLIDWSVAMVADPAFDLAFTSTMMAIAPVELPRALARPVRALSRQGAKHFLRRYRRYAPGATASLRDDVLAWYGALHCLRALIEAAEWVDVGTAQARAGHPWLTARSALAARLSAVTGIRCGS